MKQETLDRILKQFKGKKACDCDEHAVYEGWNTGYGSPYEQWHYHTETGTTNIYIPFWLYPKEDFDEICKANSEYLNWIRYCQSFKPTFMRLYGRRHEQIPSIFLAIFDTFPESIKGKIGHRKVRENASYREWKDSVKLLEEGKIAYMESMRDWKNHFLSVFDTFPKNVKEEISRGKSRSYFFCKAWSDAVEHLRSTTDVYWPSFEEWQDSVKHLKSISDEYYQSYRDWKEAKDWLN